MRDLVALDLGSTSIKAVRVDAAGRVGARAAQPAPPLARDGDRVEFDPLDYLATAARVLEAVGPLAQGCGLAIASQRSTFVLCERGTARPLARAISWQDRRAAAWCARRPDLARRIEATGLRLSPHYLAPKLAMLLEQDPSLRARAAAGRLWCATLDAFVLAHWTAPRAFRTDVTMAARTGLVALGADDFDRELLAAFDVPRDALPDIVDHVPRALRVLGAEVAVATIGDQPSGVRALLEADDQAVVVNCGTGTFVLSATGRTPRPSPGYLCGPWYAGADASLRFATEATIHAGGAAVDALHGSPVPVGPDPAPAAFCLPDAAGVGAPHWRADVDTTWSPAAAGLSPPARRRVMLEGIVFRVAEACEQLAGPDLAPTSTGGLTRDPFVAAALAATLQRPVRVLDEPEGTLFGALRVLDPTRRPSRRARTVAPDAALAGLADKRARWREWVAGLLAP